MSAVNSDTEPPNYILEMSSVPAENLFHLLLKAFKASVPCDISSVSIKSLASHSTFSPESIGRAGQAREMNKSAELQ